MTIEVLHGKAEEVTKKFEDGTFDVIATDPPYGIPVMSTIDYRHKDCGYVSPITNRGWILGDADQAKTLATYEWLINESNRLVHEHGFVYLMLSTTLLPQVVTVANDLGWRVKYLCWTKPTCRYPFPGVAWGSGFEMSLFLHKKRKPGHLFDSENSAYNWWHGAVPSGPQRVHPTQKPVGLFEHWLSRTPGRLLDPFCGAGSSLLAAQRLGLDAVGIDEEERWVEAAQKRLANDAELNYT